MQIISKYFPELTPNQTGQFNSLLPLYEEWNSKINVISRKDIGQFFLHHVLHSLAIAKIFAFEKNDTIIDLGTGGGFPGIPLAILFPDTNFHLVDSINKKLKVVTAVAEALSLNNISTQHTRIEEIGDKKVDYVVSRAVAPLQQLWQWSRPLLKRTSGKDVTPGLICLKGGDLNEEISASRTRPHITALYEIFPEDYFEEKYLLYVPVKGT